MFKKGDKVRCIDNINRQDCLDLDQIYTVEGYFTHSNINEIILKETYGASFYTYRFEPAYIKDFADKLNNILDE